MFALVALACVAPSSEDSAGFIGTDELLEPHHPAAEWTAEEAASALKEAVRFGFPMPGPLVDEWKTFLAEGDDVCPGQDWATGALSVFDPLGCEAASGYWYSGVGGAGSGWTDGDGNGSLDTYIVGMKVDGAMRDPSGATFTFGGSINFELSGNPNSGGTYEAEVLGTYDYPAADALWLREGASLGSYLEGEILGNDDWTIHGNGGFTVGGVAVAMHDFELRTACGLLPSGTIGVRGPSGYWYDLTYDETTCDACGTVVFDNRETLGTGCVDVSPAFVESFQDLVMGMNLGVSPPP